jgi:hypothetical protein
LNAGGAPFLIKVALSDGTEARVPAMDYVEVEELLGRIAYASAKARLPTPTAQVWRLDRGAPRPLSRAELEEGELHEIPILASWLQRLTGSW